MMHCFLLNRHVASTVVLQAMQQDMPDVGESRRGVYRGHYLILHNLGQGPLTCELDIHPKELFCEYGEEYR